MYPSIGRVGYPVAKTRLLVSIIAGVFFGFLLFGVSIYLTGLPPFPWIRCNCTTSGLVLPRYE